MERSTKRMKVFMPTYFIVIISLLYGQLCNCQDITTTPNQKDDEEGVQVESFEEFIPTKEWQTVKSGQTIPSGLHVRLNMETGEREAKLIDEQTENNIDKTDVSIVPDSDGQTTEEISEDRRMLRMKKAMEDAMKDLQKESTDIEEAVFWKNEEKEGMMNMFKDHFTQEELKEALKKYKAEKDDVKDEALRMEDIKNKFRPIEELRKEMEELNLDVKTDFEILDGLHSDYMKEDLSLEERLRLLSDMEYYVHQIDNAVRIVDSGAMALIIKDLNHTSNEVKAASAFVIGSAAQSNPKVQIYLIESGSMSQLLRMLSVETDSAVKNRVMYALSSLLRQFPFAQMRFLQQGGLQVFREIIVLGNNDKLKVKVVTLLGDLVHEQNSLVRLPHEVQQDKNLQQKVKQYKMVPLYDGLVDQGWCDLIPSMLYLRDHDQREKVLYTMEQLLMMQICQAEIATYNSALNDLYKEYEKLVRKELSQALEPGEDSYFTRFIELILNIKGKIEPYTVGINRDEL